MMTRHGLHRIGSPRSSWRLRPSDDWRGRVLIVAFLVIAVIGGCSQGQAAGTPQPMPPPRTGNPPAATLVPGTPIGPVPVARSTGSSVSASSTPQPAPAPHQSLLLGAYIPQGAQNPTLLDNFEAMTDHRITVVSWYQPWGYDNGWYQPRLDVAALQAVAARGATPLITWEAWGTIDGVDPSHLANIPTGAFDTYIDAWAQGLKAFGQPVYLRLFHEMNFAGYPWAFGVNGNTAQDLIISWRYVHDRFTRMGATNVRWVWCPNPDNSRVTYSAIYPGDGYVDWFGLDVFNGGTQFDWGGWLSAQQMITHSYREMEAISPGKPIMLAEVGSVEQGGSKAQWITDLYTSLPRALPNVRAMIWFDQKTETGPIQADWRVESSASALQAYIAALRQY